MPVNQQSQKFIITTANTNSPISATRVVDNSSIYNSDNTDLTRCLITTTSNSVCPSFVQQTLPSKVVRLTVVRK